MPRTLSPAVRLLTSATLIVLATSLTGVLRAQGQRQGQGRAGTPADAAPPPGRGGASAARHRSVGQVGGGVMINRNNGEGLWTLIDTPIRYTPNPDGYSQSMIPIGDGREILQLIPVGGQLKYVKFKLPATLPALEFPFAPKR